MSIEGGSGGSGLKRSSASRTNLAGSMAAAGAKPNSPSKSPSPTPPDSKPALLKRSRSMGTFDGILPRDTFGRDAVESISGKISISETTAAQLPRIPQPVARGPPSAGPSAPSPAAASADTRASAASTQQADQATPSVGVPQPAESSADAARLASRPGQAYPASESGPSAGPSAPPRSSLGVGSGSASSSSNTNTPTQELAGSIPAGFVHDASPLDDSQIQHEPLVRVDYFSHNWNESDISSSWRYIVSRRQEVANSARLENASWRTWAKAKYNLKTVSPETLNWLKDYDVTWLYGPLYHEHSGSGTSTPPLVDGGNLSPRASVDASGTTSAGARATAGARPTKIKSILKKKTLAQIMLADAGGLSPSSPGAGSPPAASAAPSAPSVDNPSHTANYLRHHIYRRPPTGPALEKMAAMLNQQYSPAPSAPVSHVASAQSVERPQSAQSNATAGSSQGERRVQFNDRVQQCIALDVDEEFMTAETSASIRETKPLDSDSDSDSDPEEAGLFLGIRRPSVNLTRAHTIAPLPATTLNYQDEDEEAESQREIISRKPGYNANYDYSSVYKIVDPHVKAVPVNATPTQQIAAAAQAAHATPLPDAPPMPPLPDGLLPGSPAGTAGPASGSASGSASETGPEPGSRAARVKDDALAKDSTARSSSPRRVRPVASFGLP